MAEIVEQIPSISFVNELDYSSTSIPRKHPRNERVTSAEELGTMSKNNLRAITLGIRAIYGGFTLSLHPLLTVTVLLFIMLGRMVAICLFRYLFVRVEKCRKGLKE